MIQECDIRQWVESETDYGQREFREAVHTILFAIGNSENLGATMIIKGGMLLAIRYHGRRYTKDIDFSTDAPYRQFDQDAFIEELDASLINATTMLDYDLDCRVQGRTVNPPNPDASFPTLQLRIGYAPKQEHDRHRRFLAGRATDVVSVDYSFNETTLETESIALSNGGRLLAYSFSDLVAEKYRSILQQGVRNRARRQDPFDLYELLGSIGTISPDEKHKILTSLKQKSASRNLPVAINSLESPEIKRRSGFNYQSIEQEITDTLPPFEEVYTSVKEFYESLPW